MWPTIDDSKLVAPLLATAAHWVRIQTSQKIQKEQKERPTRASPQKLYKKYTQKYTKIYRIASGANAVEFNHKFFLPLMLFRPHPSYAAELSATWQHCFPVDGAENTVGRGGIRRGERTVHYSYAGVLWISHPPTFPYGGGWGGGGRTALRFPWVN